MINQLVQILTSLATKKKIYERDISPATQIPTLEFQHAWYLKPAHINDRH